MPVTLRAFSTERAPATSGRIGARGERSEPGPRAGRSIRWSCPRGRGAAASCPTWHRAMDPGAHVGAGL